MGTNRNEKPQKRLHILAVRLDDETMAELRAIAKAEMRPAANLGALLITEGIERRRSAKASET
jgi:hypothetical protein